MKNYHRLLGSCSQLKRSLTNISWMLKFARRDRLANEYGRMIQGYDRADLSRHDSGRSHPNDCVSPP
ncbi:MAG: hypothetical protein F6K65_42405 [Moorea sp. SIO3C2]|nr:hypothetical protein [Moorena sp. SIO3C2]